MSDQRQVRYEGKYDIRVLTREDFEGVGVMDQDRIQLNNLGQVVQVSEAAFEYLTTREPGFVGVSYGESDPED